MKRYILFIIFFGCITASSQKLDIDRLEKTVYRYNNSLQYKKSQDTLLKILDSDNISVKERVEINILLSLTYKSLQDYASVTYYLSNAEKLAEKNKLYSAVNRIQAQFAFAYFDIQDYKKADIIMEKLAAADYEHLTDDDKSKLFVQQGYIAFLANNFKEAESEYLKAEGLMEQNNPCHLPIVYGKQMQLYIFQNNFDRANVLYERGVARAKECHILKYEVYLAEIMMNLYKDKKDINNAYKFNRKFDSLNAIFRPSENLQKLHIDREIKLRESEEKTRKSRWNLLIIYTSGCILISAVAFWLVRYARRLKSKNNEHVHTIQEMTQQLRSFEEEKQISIAQKSQLNSRQLAIIDMIKDGKTNKEIAAQLNIAESTVKYHIKIIYDLLNIRKRSHLKEKM